MVEVGQKAPDFTLYDTAGNAVRLSDFEGKSNYKHVEPDRGQWSGLEPEFGALEGLEAQSG